MISRAEGSPIDIPTGNALRRSPWIMPCYTVRTTRMIITVRCGTMDKFTARESRKSARFQSYDESSTTTPQLHTCDASAMRYAEYCRMPGGDMACDWVMISVNRPRGRYTRTLPRDTTRALNSDWRLICGSRGCESAALQMRQSHSHEHLAWKAFFSAWRLSFFACGIDNNPSRTHYHSQMYSHKAFQRTPKHRYRFPFN
jgi:hypothetical protein